MLLLPEHCIKTVWAPESSDRVTCEVNVDRRAYDGDDDNRVKPGQLFSNKVNPAGDEEGVCDKCLGPENIFDPVWRIENEDR